LLGRDNFDDEIEELLNLAEERTILLYLYDAKALSLLQGIL
jgi:hypothetical protein